MNDLVGKQYEFRSGGSGVIKTINNIQNDYVMFTDKSSVPLSNLNELFMPVISKTNISPQQQQQQQQYTQSQPQSQSINPDDFFDSSHTNKVLYETFTSDKNSPQYQQQQLQQPIISYGKEIGDNRNFVNGIPVSEATEETLRLAQENFKKGLAERKNPPIDKGLDVLFGQGAAETSHAEELKKINEMNSKLKNGDIGMDTNITDLNTNHLNQSSAKNGLPTMKKTFKIKINIELNEMIPKIEDIRAVENVFEVSLLDSLAKDIANKYLNNRQDFEDLIYGELEKIIKPKKKKPVAKKKPVIVAKKKKETDIDE